MIENQNGGGYPEPLPGPADEQPAEERHDVTSSRKSSKGGIDLQTQSKPKRKRSCPVYFGVKSYLHQFYDTHQFKDPSLYEDDDHQFLLQPHRRHRRCAPVWWKIFMWVGVVLLVFGVAGIVIGYLVPPKQTLIRAADRSHAYVNEGAEEYNTTLEQCQLVGLVLFCVGGATLAMSLLFPSFLAHYCDEDTKDDPGIKVPLQDDVIDPVNPIQMVIPASSRVKSVQPEKKAQQQMLTPHPGPADSDLGH